MWVQAVRLIQVDRTSKKLFYHPYLCVRIQQSVHSSVYFPYRGQYERNILHENSACSVVSWFSILAKMVEILGLHFNGVHALSGNVCYNITRTFLVVHQHVILVFMRRALLKCFSVHRCPSQQVQSLTSLNDPTRLFFTSLQLLCTIHYSASILHVFETAQRIPP
mmetsp:Transcript_9228/g.56078  ORF Transcript_9228/g.56078 Transcript_9228/m.56078 type:complete len:165 (-) Transcript_9228:2147-2641(-)